MVSGYIKLAYYYYYYVIIIIIIIIIITTTIIKDLGNLLSSEKINLSDLNSPKPSERSFVEDICSLLCFFSFRENLGSKT